MTYPIRLNDDAYNSTSGAVVVQITRAFIHHDPNDTCVWLTHVFTSGPKLRCEDPSTHRGRNMDIHLDAESPKARRANELARELLTSRALVGYGSDAALFTDTLGRVIDSTFEGSISSEDAALASTIAYLIAALSDVGTVAVWAAGKAFEAVDLGDPEKTTIDSIPEEHIRRVLEMISGYMASHPSGLWQEEEEEEEKMTETHLQAHIMHGLLEADVDEGIADLILACWRADIHTVNSCQENRPGTIWIEFGSADDAARFVDLVAPHEDEKWAASDFDTLWNRACGGEPEAWEWSANLSDLSEELDEDKDEIIMEGPTQAHFYISVRLPHRDMPVLVQRLVASGG